MDGGVEGSDPPPRGVGGWSLKAAGTSKPARRPCPEFHNLRKSQAELLFMGDFKKKIFFLLKNARDI